MSESRYTTEAHTDTSGFLFFPVTDQETQDVVCTIECNDDDFVNRIVRLLNEDWEDWGQ